MNLFSHPLVQCVICAVGFGIWSTVQKLFGLTIGWAMLMLTVGQFGAAFLLLRLSPEVASMRNMSLFALLGVIPNTAAIVSLGCLLRQKGEVITTWIPVMNSMMLIVALFAGSFFLGEAFTLRKLFGVGTICFGIYVLSSR